MADWDPQLYLKFEKERTQPVIDLLSRLRAEAPERIIDIGCGPGNSTLEILRKYPAAGIVGLDSSPAMLEKARSASNEIRWVLRSATEDLSQLGLFDVVFSNAAFQWIPDHKALLNNLFRIVKPGGVLAVQIPRFEEMKVRSVIKTVSYASKWKEYFQNFDDGLFYYKTEFYYDVLSALSHDVSLWVTEYFHVMPDHGGIIDWIKSTSLRPFLNHLPEDRHEAYLADLLSLLRETYELRPDGRVLFPFRRLFFVASRG